MPLPRSLSGCVTLLMSTSRLHHIACWPAESMVHRRLYAVRAAPQTANQPFDSKLLVSSGDCVDVKPATLMAVCGQRHPADSPAGSL